ncbi:MAG: hypothetical protein KAJ19_16755, partial [Gammaproteobacteria bacterium]|nr:hypothetical protein [Gammaproteobacteria bacterium]
MTQTIRIPTTNFGSGVLTPRMRRRTDIKQYYQSAEIMNDVLLFPQGGCYVRPGLEFKEEILNTPTPVDLTAGGVTVTAPGGGTAANAIDGDRTTFVVSGAIGVIDPFVVAHIDLGAASVIMFADVYDFNLSASSTDEFIWQSSTDDIAWSGFGATLNSIDTGITDRRSFGSVNARYWRLVKIGGTDLTTTTSSYSEVKLWEDSGNVSKTSTVEFDFGGGQTYIKIMTDFNLRIYDNGIKVADIPVPYSGIEIDEITYTQNTDTLLFFHKDHQTQKVVRGADAATWDLTPLIYEVIPKFAFIPTTETPAGTMTPSAISGTVTMTASVAVLLSTDVGGSIIGNGGEAKIIKFISTTVVEARILINFIDTSAIPTTEWEITRGYESVWSTARGWPRAGVFHQNRLAVGGSRDVPNGVWLSRSNDVFDFNEGSGLDNEAISTFVSTDQVNAVKHFISADRLEIFTSDAEFFIGGNPITPENVTVRRQDKRGIGDVAPVFVDGATMFVQLNADVVREFIFDAISEKYNANGISIISEHLIKTPVDMAHSRPFEDQDADLVYVVNADGTWSVLNSLRQQELTGWTSGSDDFGTMDKVGYDAGFMYATMLVTVNSVVKKYLCRFNPAHRFDYSLTLSDSPAKTVWSGLDHLEGEEVFVKADGVLLEDTFTVTAGSITISKEAEIIEAGLAYFPSVKPNPPERELQDGTMIGEIRRIIKTSVMLKDSLGVTIGGQVIPFRRFGQPIFDGPLEPFTGLKTVRHLGYSLEPQNL